MSTPGSYSVTERLRDGREIEIRGLRPDDKDGMLAAVGLSRTAQHDPRHVVGVERHTVRAQSVEQVGSGRHLQNAIQRMNDELHGLHMFLLNVEPSIGSHAKLRYRIT